MNRFEERAYRTRGSHATTLYPAVSEYCWGAAWTRHTRHPRLTWLSQSPFWARDVVNAALCDHYGRPCSWPKTRQTWWVASRLVWDETFPSSPYPRGAKLAWFMLRCLILERQSLDLQAISELTHRSTNDVRSHLRLAHLEPHVLLAAYDLEQGRLRPGTL